MYAVPCRPDSSGYGDSLYDNLDDAVKEAAIIRKEFEEREKREIEEQRQRERLIAEQKKREDMHGFVDSQSPMRRGRIIQHMQKKWTFSTVGKAMTMRDYIHHVFLEGNPEASIYKDKYNSQGYLRPEPKLSYYVNHEDVEKIAYEYLQYLIKNKVKIEAPS
jgi:hypothetical protein